ncbi:MAG: hypothetical protein J7K68_06080 [Candidatus Diapherotrites archaeon]|nr:hypothetical protein [Candidatus Diapherotrites archaeon]
MFFPRSSTHFSEIIEAKSLEEAIEKTDMNLELNVVIPLNNENIEHLRKLIIQE